MCRALFMGNSVISVKTCEAAQSLQALGIQNRFSKGAHLNIQIPTDEFVIGHGASRFISDVKLADLKRKNKSGRPFPDWNFKGCSTLRKTWNVETWNILEAPQLSILMNVALLTLPDLLASFISGSIFYIRCSCPPG